MKAMIPIAADQVAEFCRHHQIMRFSLFGSVLRHDFRPESDVDVLIEFSREAVVGFFELYDLEQELSRILGGRKVEITTPKGLSKYFRDEVMAEAETIYVKT